MNVERDIAGFALPFAVGVLLAAYAGAIFCGQSSHIHIIALLVIFIAIILLWQRKIYDFGTSIRWALICTLAFSCGILSATTAMSLFDLPQSPLETFCSIIGSRLQDLIDKIPFKSENISALIKALLTGEKGDLSSGIKTTFRDSGASHILALSGLHLGIIYGILSKTLILLGNCRAIRIIRSILIICLCGLYTLATGAGDSLVRALIFITLREVAKITCRYHGLGQILLASLVIQLVIDPLSIRSISFQLSYAAMAGIAFIYPWLQGIWDRAGNILHSQASKDTSSTTQQTELLSHAGRMVNGVGMMVNKAIRWIWNTVALSIACQLTTAPLAYIYFGTFPMHFMLTNLLTLPLTGILIPTALLTLCLSTLGCCPHFLIQITEWLTNTLIQVLSIISSM